MSRTPETCAYCGDFLHYHQPESIVYVLCGGCGAVTSSRARSTPKETRELVNVRSDESIRPGYQQALRRLGH